MRASAGFRQLKIALPGWECPVALAWYPPDLPEDWRLDYYSNQFQAVFVPATVDALFANGQAKAWLDEVAEDFDFVFEQPVPDVVIDQFGERFFGCAPAADEVWRSVDDRRAVLRRALPAGDLRARTAWLRELLVEIAPATEAVLVLEGDFDAANALALQQVAELMGIA